METISQLIESGFALGFAMTFIFWGMSIPIRWLIHHVGL